MDAESIRWRRMNSMDAFIQSIHRIEQNYQLQPFGRGTRCSVSSLKKKRTEFLSFLLSCQPHQLQPCGRGTRCGWNKTTINPFKRPKHQFTLWQRNTVTMTIDEGERIGRSQRCCQDRSMLPRLIDAAKIDRCCQDQSMLAVFSL